MDNVTHALAGLLVAEAAVAVVERRAGHPASPGFRRAALLVGVIAAELPDADLLYSNGVLGIGKLGYLLHHRGHTHTVLFALVAGLLIWAVAVALRRGRPPSRERTALLAVALVGTISHLALDFTNSYGIHPFWPVENSWYYGDAVFIVEPWLWIAGLAPLLLLARGLTGRVVCGLLLVGIIAAAWRVGQVAPAVALALTIGAAVWVALLAAMPRGRRIVLALAVWCLIEAVFFTSAFAAREAVRMATTTGYRDAVLTPAIGDPFCVNALVVELDRGTYRVTSATVTPLPAVRGLDDCAPPSALRSVDGRPSGRVGTERVRWGADWSAPHAELLVLAAENCEIAAALRFIRVPVWRTRPDGDVHFADLRYGGSGDGFADLVTARRVEACPRFIPAWNGLGATFSARRSPGSTATRLTPVPVPHAASKPQLSASMHRPSSCTADPRSRRHMPRSYLDVSRLRTTLATLAIGAMLLSPLGVPVAAQTPTFDDLLRAEDRRAPTGADLDVLRAAATAPDPEMRRLAVRGLGRLERPAVLDPLIRALADADPGVRHAAADAVGQAVARGERAAAARAALFARLATETDPAVRGQLAENAGRIRADSGEVAQVAERLAGSLPLRGAVRGLFFLSRQRNARGRMPASVGDRLHYVATTPANADDVRATAAAARLAVGGATPEQLAAFRRDPSPEIRALVATAASIDDPAPLVRYRAIAQADCPALVGASRDRNAHVALAAIDALAKCTGDAAASAALDVSASPRAVVAQARVAPARARARLATLTSSRDPFTRTSAARGARAPRYAHAAPPARDPDANVASAAIEGLASITGARDAALYTAALRSDASQLLMAAARALAGPSAPAPPLIAALDRVTARRRETSRDARLALVEALGARVPERYARDFDPVIAARAAELAGVAAAPTPLPPEPPPTVAQLRAISGATIEMADGGRIELALFPMDAPTNTWRFVRLAREGFYDGLTFHRVVPFFVVQGGSPLANEYAGDGPFTRDELARENRRGTVGVSTRGRDTGDGQLYINTVDNVRLDHDYTVFADVVSGMDVVDRLQEGAKILRITVR